MPPDTTDATAATAATVWTCPRCGLESGARFYGPCDPCRGDLRATIGREPDTTVAADEYEPKMNVTPNAVALKD